VARRFRRRGGKATKSFFINQERGDRPLLNKNRHPGKVFTIVCSATCHGKEETRVFRSPSRRKGEKKKTGFSRPGERKSGKRERTLVRAEERGRGIGHWSVPERKSLAGKKKRKRKRNYFFTFRARKEKEKKKGKIGYGHN